MMVCRFGETFGAKGVVVTEEFEPGGLGLAAAIELLRVELEEARRAGEGHAVQFGVDEVSLTLTVVAGRKKEAGAKLRWWVIEAGGQANFDNSETQTLVLTLKPKIIDVTTGTQVSLQVKGVGEGEEL